MNDPGPCCAEGCDRFSARYCGLCNEPVCPDHVRVVSTLLDGILVVCEGCAEEP